MKNLLRNLSFALAIPFLFSSCEGKQNTLTAQEMADGWELLFDGTSVPLGTNDRVVVWQRPWG